MPSSNDIVTQMTQALSLSIPSLDTSIGQPIRAILDVVGEMIAEQTADQYLLSSQYDVNSKSGADLDSYCAQFGINRFPAKQAVGYVTFSAASASSDIYIPQGTQVATNGTPQLIFSTLFPATLPQSAITTSVSIPVQAAIGGSAGNVGSGQIVAIQAGLTGITNGVTNSNPLTGGTDAESDDQLRLRFVSTVFRGMTGTEQMYTAVALDDANVSLVNVMGVSETYVEQILISGGTGTSSVPDLKYFFSNTDFFGNNINAGDIFAEGSQYTIASSGFNSPPVITVIDTTNIPDGVYELQFDYLSTASRNDPANGVTNRIDIYVNGDRPAEATQNVTFENTYAFNNSDPIGPTGLNVSQFTRTDGVTAPSVNNIFVPLAFPPIEGSAGPTAGTIVLNSNSYIENTDYWWVNDTSIWGGSINSRAGLECNLSTMGASGNNGQGMVPDYFFNQIPQSINANIQQYRLLTTDCMVHQANEIFLDLFMAVVLSSGGFTLSTVQALAATSIESYLASISFEGVVQVSELLSLVQQTPGVAACRFLNNADTGLALTSNGGTFTTSSASQFAILSVNPSNESTIFTTYAETATSPHRAIDVVLDNRTLANLNQLYLTQLTNNTFGAV